MLICIDSALICDDMIYVYSPLNSEILCEFMLIYVEVAFISDDLYLFSADLY